MDPSWGSVASGGSSRSDSNGQQSHADKPKAAKCTAVRLSSRTTFKTVNVSEHAKLYLITTQPHFFFRQADAVAGFAAAAQVASYVSETLETLAHIEQLQPSQKQNRHATLQVLDFLEPNTWLFITTCIMTVLSWILHNSQLTEGLFRQARIPCALAQDEACFAESVLAIRGMGLQVKSRWAGGRQVTRFVDVQHLQAAVINEAYSCFKVHFYLAFVLVGQRTLDVAFRGHEPRLPLLQAVYAGLQEVLFGEAPCTPLTQERYDEALSVGRKQLQEYRHGLQHGGVPSKDGLTHSRTPYAARLWVDGVVSPYGGGDDTTGAVAYMGGQQHPVVETELDRWAAEDQGLPPLAEALSASQHQTGSVLQGAQLPPRLPRGSPVPSL